MRESPSETRSEENTLTKKDIKKYNTCNKSVKSMCNNLPQF